MIKTLFLILSFVNILLSHGQTKELLVNRLIKKTDILLEIGQIDEVLKAKVAKNKNTIKFEGMSNKFPQALFDSFNSKQALTFLKEYFIKEINVDSLKLIVKFKESRLSQRVLNLRRIYSSREKNKNN
ncbi:hypothetical protein [Tenacibaculum sp. 190524A02b]|uniref:Uncharacterized protein n=1 Tax=Tenacibaculum vairaonense TaxID=3137860 RepID=A0ABM9PML7_9FLAO